VRRPKANESIRAAVVVAAVAVLAAFVAGGGSAAATNVLRAGQPTLAALVRSDASAKELARTAQTVAEVYATEHNGSYAGLTIAKAERIEPSLKRTTNAKLILMLGHTSSFRLTTRAVLTRQTFSISVGPSGRVKRRCSAGLTCTSGAW
jgi:ribosomal protein S8E